MTVPVGCSGHLGNATIAQMIDIVPSSPDTFRTMRTLADSVFTMTDMCALAGELGARSRASDAALRTFDLPGGGVLQIAAADEQGELVGAVIVTLCSWDPGVTADLASDPGRSAYDGHYDKALTMATATIGMPRYSGADPTGFPFQWSAWVGQTGIMALQQSHYDYCPDISLWIRREPGRTRATSHSSNG
jgi:hypothetical protein